ncbi:replicative DNA helicase [Leptolyngbya cf. ectocarpi LEGE 11479]|uniref:Replicative DNA helicase n=1 Tax=Leptolyngbya cf. ectocarpi LEGE 11479 TaxID=1828722 RepID=A0A928X1D7_LEPEC|nr:replicative DNA helicase [Leptolyngbya ectocarpi]MBE9065208.1 replicative DNA helicase [Leptolyngbya cf. ectocarpi LEGE 11479]
MAQERKFQADFDRLPPQNIEAEEAILGGILLDPEAIGRVTEIIVPEAFYIGGHREIYRAAVELQAKGKPTDLMTVASLLKDKNLLEKAGGQSRLAQLFDRTISAANIDQYAKLVMEKYTRRQLIQIGGEIAQLGYETESPLETVLDQSEQKVFGLTQERPQQGLTATSDILTETFDDIEQRSMGMVLPGLSCGFYDLDAMTQGFQRSDLIIAAGRPAMGKCLSADAKILLADGSLKTIEEIYQQRQGQLLTLNNQWRFEVTQPSAFVDDGIKPVFQVTTRLGRKIKTTYSHPYLTMDGWLPLSSLSVGEKIAIPRKLQVFGSQALPAHQVKLLGYLIGDGSLTGNAATFTHENPLLQTDFTAAASQFSYKTLRRTGKNPVAAWLDGIGLWGLTAHDQHIPDAVFTLPKQQLALFINRLFSTDGWASVLSSGQAQLGYATISETLARQLQHLLLRFGIVATLKQRRVKYKNTRRPAWQLDITDAIAIHTFITEIGIFGKEQAVCKVADAISNKRYHSNRDLIPKPVWAELKAAKGDESWKSIAARAGFPNVTNIHVGKRALSRPRLAALATALEHESLQHLATSDIYWDEIVAIEPMGSQQVYDLTIPETHNFVANDICVHNTSFVLNVARNIAGGHKQPIAIFSLEMSKQQLVYRLLSAEARIESGRLRTGRIGQHEWEPLGHAISSLSQIPIFIDDTPNISVTEMRSKCRRLKAENGGALGLILIDYLQLMEGSSDNRVQELSKITRSLKGLARELNVPIISLSQLSRGVESRTNKRPMMSDLRESGCLSGETLIALANTGKQVPIRELVGQSDFYVWAFNENTCKLEASRVSNAFATGVQPVFKLTTQLGRTIRATSNHKFRTFDSWQRLDNLKVGECIALPRKLRSDTKQTLSDSELGLLGHLIGDGCTLPRHVIQYTTREADLAQIVVDLAKEIFGTALQPRINKERQWYQVYLPASQHLTHRVRNPIAEWLDRLGIFGLRSHEKRVPELVFQQPEAAVATFLRHLWSTDGCIKLVAGQRARPIAYYASSSEQLAQDVQSLLLRLGINARLKKVSQGKKGRVQNHVVITGKIDLTIFIELVGAIGEYKLRDLEEIKSYLINRKTNTNRDIIPMAAWQLHVLPAMTKANLSQRDMQAQLKVPYCGTTLFKQNMSRARAQRVAAVVDSPGLSKLANSDLYWDKVASIEPDGTEEVFDLTVPENHNFIANNIVVHNSIEQDADLIMMLYREEYYDPDTPDRGLAEVIIAKHRNGPTGTVKLLFEPQYTLFRNLANSKS